MHGTDPRGDWKKPDRSLFFCFFLIGSLWIDAALARGPDFFRKRHEVIEAHTLVSRLSSGHSFLWSFTGFVFWTPIVYWPILLVSTVARFLQCQSVALAFGCPRCRRRYLLISPPSLPISRQPETVNIFNPSLFQFRQLCYGRGNKEALHLTNLGSRCSKLR